MSPEKAKPPHRADTGAPTTAPHGGGYSSEPSTVDLRPVQMGLFGSERPEFDGKTVEPEDKPRLGRQLHAVLCAMRSGRWLSLASSRSAFVMHLVARDIHVETTDKAEAVAEMRARMTELVDAWERKLADD